ncbi:MAG TPA: MBL fold metallo-hydrolase [Kofleriaceae bacterium]|jgi:glyoxylase-like metal-dependent hydrolase (beta-lactamase superfamily II)
MIERTLAMAAVLVACGGSRPSAPARSAYDPEPTVIAGAFPPNRSPDGNSVILRAPRGLIVVDTGRHPTHQQKLLAFAGQAGAPIAAIVNTHWHLDHTGGNAELRAAYPGTEIIATRAIDGALVGFLAKGRAQGAAMIASGKAEPQQIEDIELDRAAVDAPRDLLPTRAIARSGAVDVAGRRLDLHVAAFAATEADLWIYDAQTRTVIAGDLVVAEVPFFDTGCPEGWRAALGEIAATPFVRLIPGHGEAMTRDAFARWRAAFDALLDCAASPAEVATCVAGWRAGAAAFIPAGDEARIDAYAAYYVSQILRSPAARERFCKPLRAE